MKKTDAIEIFGSAAELARALGVTRGAISQWPDDLDQRKADLVTGAALRLGRPLPGSAAADAAETRP